MFSFTVFLIFVLFFILMIFVKDKEVLLRIVKVFLIIILGGLVIMGILAIFTGVSEFLNGDFDQKQLFIQVGAGILFVAAGGFSLYTFFVSRVIMIRKFERRKNQYPDAPWMWVDHWSKKRIVYYSKGPTALVWFVLFGLMAGLSFVSYVNREIILSKAKSHDVEFILFFIVLAVILIPCFFYAISLLRGHLKFGNSIFEMSTYPGIIGGKLAGTIHTKIKQSSKKEFDLELRCGYIDLTTKVGREMKNRYMTKILWSEAQKTSRGNLSRSLYGISIPVSFSIPADVPESDAWSSDKRIVWTLLASSNVDGASYLSKFDVPVFQDRNGSLEMNS